jgi:hypothetical protein
MKFKIIVISFFVSFFSLTSFAGSGHDHGHDNGHAHEQQRPVDKSQAEANALKVMKSLVDRKKIEPSWSESVVRATKKQGIYGSYEWLTIFICGWVLLLI